MSRRVVVTTRNWYPRTSSRQVRLLSALNQEIQGLRQLFVCSDWFGIHYSHFYTYNWYSYRETTWKTRLSYTSVIQFWFVRSRTVATILDIYPLTRTKFWFWFAIIFRKDINIITVIRPEKILNRYRQFEYDIISEYISEILKLFSDASYMPFPIDRLSMSILRIISWECHVIIHHDETHFATTILPPIKQSSRTKLMFDDRSEPIISWRAHHKYYCFSNHFQMRSYFSITFVSEIFELIFFYWVLIWMSISEE